MAICVHISIQPVLRLSSIEFQELNVPFSLILLDILAIVLGYSELFVSRSLTSFACIVFSINLPLYLASALISERKIIQQLTDRESDLTNCYNNILNESV